MSLLAIFGSVIGGYFAGNLLFIAVLRWIATIIEARNHVISVEGRAVPGRVALLAFSQSLFQSGPWLVAAVAFFAYHVYSESWAPWFFGGFFAGIAILGIASAHARKAARENGDRAHVDSR